MQSFVLGDSRDLNWSKKGLSRFLYYQTNAYCYFLSSAMNRISLYIVTFLMHYKSLKTKLKRILFVILLIRYGWNQQK